MMTSALWRIATPVEQEPSTPSGLVDMNLAPLKGETSVMLTEKIASDAVLDEAYAWLCYRRRDYSAIPTSVPSPELAGRKAANQISATDRVLSL
jgi:hypothetical protein